MLHELLFRSGGLVRVHEAVGATGKVPDFLVTSGDRDVCIEAALLTGESGKERAARKRINEVYDILNDLDSPDFSVGIELRGAPNSPPRARKLADSLREWLAGLDADSLREDLDAAGISALPRFSYQHDGWRVRFSAIPKSSKMRGQRGVRPLAMITTGVEWDRSRESFQSVLKKKAGKYGRLEIPFVIAVNAATMGSGELDHDDVIDALFGSVVVEVTSTGNGFQQQQMRSPDGLWHGKSGPQYRGVSAVLVFYRALPCTIDTTGVQLYLNPWADNPYEGELKAFDYWEVDVTDGRLTPHRGITLPEILAREGP